MNQPNNAAPANRVEQIAALNDELRANIMAPGNNQVVMTAGIADMIGDVTNWTAWKRRAELIRTVRDFEAFDEGDNPHGERDFGAFDWQNTRVFWKIDYYDQTLNGGSPDPANPEVTCRVLTILRADEY